MSPKGCKVTLSNKSRVAVELGLVLKGISPFQYTGRLIGFEASRRRRSHLLSATARGAEFKYAEAQKKESQEEGGGPGFRRIGFSWFSQKPMMAFSHTFWQKSNNINTVVAGS